MSIKADFKGLQNLLHIDEASIPDRNSSSDWAYGDVNEVLASIAAQTQSLQSYCLNR